jgi:glycerophosphoryl diester phosphodiesterase
MTARSALTPTKPAARAWPYPKLVAHRGAGKLAPENTLAAFKVGYGLGYRMFECDVKLSADAVAYLMHDPSLERCSNGSGSAAGLNWTQLSQLDAGSWHSADFAGEAVPTLANIAAFVRANQCWLNIEIKPIAGTEAITGAALAHAAAALWLGDARQPLLSSFSADALAAAQHAQPQLPRALLVDRIPSNWADQLSALGCEGVVCNHLHLNDQTVLAIRRAGYALAVYTCNDPARVGYLLDLGVNTVITDAVNVIKPV